MAYDSKILVVIPYLASEAQGGELEYAVRGWLSHFKEDHQIVIVGDRHPIADRFYGITFIDCPRISADNCDPFDYLPHLDIVHKFRVVREHFPYSQGFIYTCDDIYPVNDFDLGEVLIPKISRWDIEGDATSPNGWKRDQAKTRRLCCDYGWRHHDWVCHLPVYYRWDKLMEVYDLFDCDNKSYVVENIYFNRYFEDRTPLLVDGNNTHFKYEITGKEASGYVGYRKLGAAMMEKIWINNSPNGYSDTLVSLLREHFEL